MHPKPRNLSLKSLLHLYTIQFATCANLLIVYTQRFSYEIHTIPVLINRSLLIVKITYTIYFISLPMVRPFQTALAKGAWSLMYCIRWLGSYTVGKRILFEKIIGRKHASYTKLRHCCFSVYCLCPIHVYIGMWCYVYFFGVWQEKYLSECLV